MDKYCLDCGKKLWIGNTSGRCRSCLNTYKAQDPEFGAKISRGLLNPTPKPKNYCIGCGKELKGHGDPIRCRSCASKERARILAEEGRLGTPCTEERKQRISAGMKAAHERGCYDDWMPQFAQVGADLWNNENFRLEHSERLKQYWVNPEARKAQSKRIKQYYIDHPDFAAANAEHMRRISEEYWSDPANHEWFSNFMLELWQDPVYREQGLEHIYNVLIPAFQTYISDPENLQKHSDTIRQYYIDNPEYREAITQHLRDYWADPEHCQQMSESNLERYSKVNE